MAWWSRFFERRAVYMRESHSWSDMGLTAPTSAGLTVTPQNALQVPSVAACCAILSQDVAKTFLKFRQRIGPDTYEDAVDHPLYELLGTLPNPETTAYSFKRQLMVDLLQHEHGYAEVVREDGRVAALWRLDPCRMRIERDGRRQKVYVYTLPDGTVKQWTFNPSQPPLLDLEHPSPLHQCTDLIATALALQIFTGKFFSQGGRPTGVLTTPGHVDPMTMQRLRESWTEIYGRVENAHKVAILEGGLKFDALAPHNDEAQLNELSQTLRSEIAAIFRVPVWRVGDMSHATYSNLEASEQAYVGDALDPFFTTFEESIRRDLLTVRQYNQFSVTFDRSSLIRSDRKSLSEALATGRQNGWYSANDIRRKLGENPIPAAAGGDEYLINTALAPIEKADDHAA